MSSRLAGTIVARIGRTREDRRPKKRSLGCLVALVMPSRLVASSRRDFHVGLAPPLVISGIPFHHHV